MRLFGLGVKKLDPERHDLGPGDQIAKMKQKAQPKLRGLSFVLNKRIDNTHHDGGFLAIDLEIDIDTFC